MLVALATVIGHASFPHHHHIEIHSSNHYSHSHDHNKNHHEHNHDSNEPHNIFSFSQLDENFLPKQFGKSIIELLVVYLVTPFITYQINSFKQNTKTHFGYYMEYPPPDNFLPDLFSRPPPVKC
jgi:hypothetical protein